MLDFTAGVTWRSSGPHPTPGSAAALALAAHSSPRGSGWWPTPSVHPSHRGHGLAEVTKQYLHREAAARGATAIVTDNEADNLGIRAVNKRLGYHQVSGQHRHIRDLRTHPMP